jgi:hypothetical protein
MSQHPVVERARRSRASGFALAALALLAGCGARRSMLIESDPPGALVRLDQEVIGVTPLEHPFEHYGTRRLSLYLPGYRTWSERIDVDAPWWAWFPVDVFAEVLLPFAPEDHPRFTVTLAPDDGVEGEGDLEVFIDGAMALHREERAAAAAAAEAARAGTQR